MTDLSKIYEAIKEDILEVFVNIVHSNVGVNKKTGSNTLIGSSFETDAKVEVSDSGDGNIFSFIYNFYGNDKNTEFGAIDDGRKPRTTKVPIKALRDWAVKKGLSTDNNFLYAVRESIYKNGIPPRPVLSTWENQLDSRWEIWSDKIFEEITKQLDIYFNK